MTDKPIDAVICSRDFPQDHEDVHVGRNKVLGPILGAARVHSCGLYGFPGRYLVRALDDHGTLMYPTNSGKNHEFRHEWRAGEVVDGEAVVGDEADIAAMKTSNLLFGFLKD